MEEEKSKKNKGKGLIVALVIAIVIILGLVGYICYDKGIILYKNKNKETTNIEEEKVEEVVEKEITDENTKQSILDKIYFLNIKTAVIDSPKINNYMEFIYPYVRSELYSANLNSSEKIFAAINSLGKEFEPLTVSYENMEASVKEKFKVYSESTYFSSVVRYQISSSKVEQRYKELFGENLLNHKDVGRCPFYTYDSVNNLYYFTSECGGTSASTNALYVNKITTLDDNIYAYVNLAYITPHGDDISSSTSDIYDGVSNEGKLIETTNDKYNLSENYTKFTNYKYTFKKDSTGNYYFVKVEQQ